MNDPRAMAPHQLRPEAPFQPSWSSSQSQPDVGKDVRPAEAEVAPEKTKLCLSWQSCLGVGAGLQNSGNSCYLNAVLQCLTYTPPLANSLLSGQHSQNSCVQQGQCTMCAMESHVRRTLGLPGDVILPSWKLTAAFHRAKQEDAHEFLMFILNAMHEDCLPAGCNDHGAQSEDSTPIREIFQGSWRSQIKCLQCQGTSDTFDPYLDITLDIQAAQSLQQALADLVRPEELRGENAYHCGICQRKGPASKTLTLHTASKVLMLVLKRFSALTGDKVDKAVNYPEKLDLAPYMPGQNRGPLLYLLYAVLVHTGTSCHAGHYFCYIKAGTGQWYKMDDAKVASCDETSVLSQRAYLLFYVQQTDLKLDRVEGPVGIPPCALGPAPKVKGDLEGQLKMDSSLQEGEESESRGHPEKTPTEELCWDLWKSHLEQNRPKPEWNLRKIDSTLPEKVVVIHPSKCRGDLGKGHLDKENHPGPNSAGGGSKTKKKKRKNNNNSKEGRRRGLVI